MVLLECVVCRKRFDHETTEHVRSPCKHHAHLSCVSQLIVAGRWRCMGCPAARSTMSAVLGQDAVQSERIAAAMREAREDEVGVYLTTARARRTPPKGARRALSYFLALTHAFLQ